jgi:hypothetical protein
MRQLGNTISAVLSGRLCCLAFACLLLGLTTGCGKPPIRIEGNVALDGEPVADGSISFEPVDGQGSVTGGTIAAGRYVIEGDPAFTPGEKVVRIVGVRKTGRKLPNPEAKGEFIDEVEMHIPSEYNTDSQLTVKITEGPNTHDFKLQKSGTAK